MSFLRLLLVPALLLAITALPARAEYPERDIKIICGFPAGTGADTIVRYFANELQKQVGGKAVIVENRPGALSNVGAKAAAMAKPDGYTLLITPGNSTMAANQHLFKEKLFDPINDFTPVYRLIKLSFMWSVDAKSPIKTLSELTALMKQKGDKGTYAYSNPFGRAAAELYKIREGLPTVGVAYQGTPDAMRDMLGGQVDFLIGDSTFVMEQARSGKIRLLANTTAQRTSVAPDLPSSLEAGIKDYDLSAWWGIWLPAGAPPDIVAKLAGYFQKIVGTEDTRKFMANVAAEPYPGDAKALKDMTVAEIAKWGDIIKQAKIEAQ
jgi:tripartite-type tricarboxylate transporter receptor subunit TctC